MIWEKIGRYSDKFEDFTVLFDNTKQVIVQISANYTRYEANFFKCSNIQKNKL